MDEQPAKSSVPSDLNKATNQGAAYSYGISSTPNSGSSFSFYPSYGSNPPAPGFYNFIPIPDHRLRMNYLKEDANTPRNEPTSSASQGHSTPPVVYSTSPKRQMPVAHIGTINGEAPKTGQSASSPRCNEGEGKKGDQREDVMYLVGTSELTMSSDIRPSIGSGPIRPTVSSTMPPSIEYCHAMGLRSDDSPSCPEYGRGTKGPPAPDWHRLYTAPSAAPTREPKSPPSWSHPGNSMLPIPPAQQPMFQIGDGTTFAMPPALRRETVEPKNLQQFSHYKLPPRPYKPLSLQHKQQEKIEMDGWEREERDLDSFSTKAESSDSSTRNTVIASLDPLSFLSPDEALRRERERDLRDAEAKGERKLNQTWRSSYGRNKAISPENPLLSSAEDETRHPLRKIEARIERKINAPSDPPTMKMNDPASQSSKAAGEGQSHTQTMDLQNYQMQLMLLEQRNKKRLMMARQEQESKTLPRGPDAPKGQASPGTGPIRQPFQGTSACSKHSPEALVYIPKPTPVVNYGLGFYEDTNASAHAPSSSTTVLQKFNSSDFNQSSAALAKEIASRIKTQIGCPDSKPLNPITRSAAEPEPLDLDAEFSDVMLVIEEDQHPRAEVEDEEDEDEDWLVV